MTRRVIGSLSLVVVALAAVGLLSFTFLGTATGVAGSANASAYGARVSLDTAATSATLVGPLPKVAADSRVRKDEASLVRIADIPPGGALVDEIAALYVRSAIDLAAGTATASSDTAHVGLLKTTSAAAVPGLNLPGLPNLLPGQNNVPGARTNHENLIDVDALHGIVALDCDKLASLRSASEVTRLTELTKGSTVLRARVLGAQPVPESLNTLTDNLGSTTDDHAAALHLRIDGSLLGLSNVPLIGGRIIEIWLYEVKGTNLTSPSFRNVTASLSVDMLHVKVLDKATGLLEADVRVGHAEASLSNCGQPTATPSPTTPVPTATSTNARFDVDATKVVESINGAVVTTQSGLRGGRGQQIEYSLNVFNRSFGEACAITRVVDQLPANMSFVSDAGDFGAGRYDPATNTVTWDTLAIPNGEARRHGIVVRLADNAPAGVYVNRFTATGTCGSFVGEAPGIEVRNTAVLGTKTVREIPRTGVADNAYILLGLMTVAVAAGGFGLLRKA